jgi:hypothetical protein
LFLWREGGRSEVGMVISDRFIEVYLIYILGLGIRDEIQNLQDYI